MRILPFLAFVILTGCSLVSAAGEQSTLSKAEQIRATLENASNKTVLVVAHRAAWKNAPENSRLAVQQAIDMGVDMVEIDIRKTKDGQFVLMHDTTIDRTTNGKGSINSITLKTLQTFQLKGPGNNLTKERVPTLREILELCRGKILINLDKAENYMDEIAPLLEETGTARQVLFKGWHIPELVSRFLEKNRDVLYMSMFVFRGSEGKAEISEMYPIDKRVRAVEVKWTDSNHPAASTESFSKLNKRNVRVWVNTIHVSHAVDYTDERALQNPDAVWGKLIDRGVSIIQTDEPRALLDYLRDKGFHD